MSFQKPTVKQQEGGSEKSFGTSMNLSESVVNHGARGKNDGHVPRCRPVTRGQKKRSHTRRAAGKKEREREMRVDPATRVLVVLIALLAAALAGCPRKHPVVLFPGIFGSVSLCGAASFFLQSPIFFFHSPANIFLKNLTISNRCSRDLRTVSRTQLNFLHAVRDHSALGDCGFLRLK
jgi:hypothetical protein